MRLAALTLVTALLLGAAVALPAAHAQGVIQDMKGMSDQEAKAHFKVGKSLYETGRFAEAGAEWMKAYELSQRVELLYNVYVAYRDASDLPHAIDALERYLAGNPQFEGDTRLNLEARLRSMKEANARGTAATTSEPGSAPTPEPAPAPAPDTITEPAPAPAPTATPAAASSNDAAPRESSLLPYVLLGVGGALIVGGAITGAIVLGKVGDLEDACPDDRCADPSSLDDRDSAKTLAIVTDVLLGAGVATAAVGAVLLLTQDDGDGAERDATTGAFGCGPDGCMASVRGRF